MARIGGESMNVKTNTQFCYFQLDKGWIVVKKQDKRLLYDIIYSLDNAKLHEVMRECDRRDVWYEIKNVQEVSP